MVRTQLYLPEDTYKAVRKKAKAKNMTFAAYVRIFLETEVLNKESKKKTLYQRFPFLKFAGQFHIDPDKDLSNEAIDKAIYDL